jgi:hypothetical protein
MTNRKIMQQALECIERLNAHGWILADFEDEVYAAITALKAALEQPEQEPVAIVTSETGNPDITMSWWHEPALPMGTKLYTQPPAAQPEPPPEKEWVYGTPLLDAMTQDYVPAQRPWVGLTDEEIKEIVGPYGDTPVKGYTRQLFDQIEAKLREKNQ